MRTVPQPVIQRECKDVVRCPSLCGVAHCGLNSIMRTPHLLLLAAMLALATCAHAETTARQNELVIIDSERGEPYGTVREAMLKSLADAGYKDGSTLKVLYYSLDNLEARAPNLWKLVGPHKDAVFYTNGTVATAAFKRLAFDDGVHRFVFGAVTDPVGLGVIDGLKRAPRQNFTGVSYAVPVKERFHFLKRLFPNATKIGLIYADMPQSHSYRRWIEEMLRTDDEFKGMQVFFRMVPFVKSEGGHKRMALQAEQFVKELDGQVDVFLSPNDQMGVQAPFANMVFKSASKPLIGLGKKDVVEAWGATATISPSLDAIGQKSAAMVAQLFAGKPIAQVLPDDPGLFDVAIDVAKARAFGARLPPDLLQDARTTLIDK
jgi:putative ABC transport system substrate-binding protein